MTANKKVQKILKVLSDKKAQDIKVFNVKNNSDIWDYFVIATALSEPHLRSLYNYLTEEMEKQDYKIFYKDTGEFKNWVVIDFGEILVHLFDKDTRLFYSIEKLWGEKEEKIKKSTTKSKGAKNVSKNKVKK